MATVAQVQAMIRAVTIYEFGFRFMGGESAEQVRFCVSKRLPIGAFGAKFSSTSRSSIKCQWS
jgi:hypothetical protein